MTVPLGSLVDRRCKRPAANVIDASGFAGQQSV